MESKEEINGVKDLLEIVNLWEEQTHPEPGKPHWIWFRGQSDSSLEPLPGTLRPEFLKQADDLFGWLPQQDRGLQLELRVNGEFRRRGWSGKSAERII